ncbi:uncharacterized protein LOC108097031 [Drosophila ficusphila]|uniref:uncharacterized protein LOC108097031 n=1 Tax=Drosophila ficusphila TaxID=30025 RepID=UPI0007E628AC|nr:uncharacterized protein LOC108097031 [Drosophila ficusphila]
MCSNLSDLFACIRAQEDSEADRSSTTHRRNNADVDEEAPDPQRDLLRRQQQRQRELLLQERNFTSKVPLLDTLPPSLNGCIHPPSISLEARAPVPEPE